MCDVMACFVGVEDTGTPLIKPDITSTSFARVPHATEPTTAPASDIPAEGGPALPAALDLPEGVSAGPRMSHRQLQEMPPFEDIPVETNGSTDTAAPANHHSNNGRLLMTSITPLAGVNAPLLPRQLPASPDIGCLGGAADAPPTRRLLQSPEAHAPAPRGRAAQLGMVSARHSKHQKCPLLPGRESLVALPQAGGEMGSQSTEGPRPLRKFFQKKTACGASDPGGLGVKGPTSGTDGTSANGDGREKLRRAGGCRDRRGLARRARPAARANSQRAVVGSAAGGASSRLSIASANVNSLRNRVDHIAALIETYHLDIVCIQETKLSSSVPDCALCIENFNLHRQDRNDNGGGVAIYIRDTLSATRLTFDLSHLEMVGVAVTVGKLVLNCISVYRPPGSNITDFYETLADATFHVFASSDYNCILGDTNVDYFDPSKRKYIADFCTECELRQMVDQVTHKNSLIDHVYVSNKVDVVNLRHLSPVENHHHVITFDITFSAVVYLHSSVAPVGRRLWSKCDWNAINFDLARASLPNAVVSATTVEDSWNAFHAECVRVIDRRVPTGRRRRRFTPWFTNKVAALLRKRDGLHRRWRATNDPKMRAKYCSVRKAAKKCIAKAKKEYVGNLFDTNNCGQFWRSVRLLTRGGRQSVPPLQNADGKLVVDDDEKVEILAQQYISVYDGKDTRHVGGVHASPMVNDPALLCSPEWVQKQLMSTKLKKASGLDGLSAAFLRNTANLIALPVSIIINRSINEGVIPTSWKLARIAPVPKVRGSADPADYRPISILPLVSLIAERHIYSLIYPLIEPRLPVWQFGFRKSRSTTDALLLAEHLIVQGWAHCRREKFPTNVAVVSLDLHKAFDTIPHHIVLAELTNVFGIPSLLMRWLANYISDRSQVVQLGDSTSNPFSVVSGVPQGSVLGPLIYIAATSSLQDLTLSRGSHIIAYADDVLVIKPIMQTCDILHLQDDLSAVASFFENRGMKLNSKKTTFLTCSLDRRVSNEQRSVVVQGSVILESNELKYLGVLFDRGLSFVTHLRQKAKKARQMLASIRGALVRWKQYRVLGTIYRSCIRPIMSYALPIVFGITKNGDRLLNRVDHIALRAVTNDYQKEVDHLRHQVGWTSFFSESQKFLLHLFYLLIQRHSLNTFYSPIEPVTNRRSIRLGRANQWQVKTGSSLSRVAKSCVNRACILYNQQK